MALGESFETVLAAAQAGEEWAYSILYRELNPRLIRYFASRVPREAEDLAAETWMGAARNVGGFSGDERAFVAWLFTVAHRQLVQHWREQARRPAPQLEPYFRDDAASTDVEGEVLTGIEASEAARAIAAALTPDQAEVILLRILGGLDVDQVARIVGKRPGTVRVLQHKALRKLAKSSFSSEVLTQ